MPSLSTRSQSQSRSREFPPLKLLDKMPFGKFKGCTIKSIIDRKSERSYTDGGTYIQWCLENIDTFILDDEAQLYFETNHKPKTLNKGRKGGTHGGAEESAIY